MVLEWHKKGGKKHTACSGGKRMKVSLPGKIVGNFDIA